MVTGGGPDLSHLHPAARAAALLPDAERLRLVRADRWIGYTRATEALPTALSVGTASRFTPRYLRTRKR